MKYDPKEVEDFVHKPSIQIEGIQEKEWRILQEKYNAEPEIHLKVRNIDGNNIFATEPVVCGECKDIYYQTNLIERAQSLNNSKIWINLKFVDSLQTQSKKKDKIVSINVNSSDEVSLVKMKITEATGLSPEQQELSYRGIILEDDKTLLDSIVVPE